MTIKGVTIDAPGEGNSMELKGVLVLASSQYPLAAGLGYTLANKGRSDYNKIKGA